MNREIAIVGGGMAGLEAAIGLTVQNTQNHVTVFERGSSRYPGDKEFTQGKV